MPRNVGRQTRAFSSIQNNPAILILGVSTITTSAPAPDRAAESMVTPSVTNEIILELTQEPNAHTEAVALGCVWVLTRITKRNIDCPQLDAKR
jgi:hypothetical protein